MKLTPVPRPDLGLPLRDPPDALGSSFVPSWLQDDWDAVRDVRARSVDAAAGFASMVKRARPPFRAVAERFRDLHTFHAEQLARLMLDAGQAPTAKGSFMTVNHTVVSLRRAFDAVDADLMDSVRSGEEHVVESFRNALDGGLPMDVQESLARMLGELEALLVETSMFV